MELSESFYAKTHSRLMDLGYRGDMQIADWKQLNSKNAKLLLAYNSNSGVPNRDEISDFILKIFDGRIIPRLETACIYKRECVASIVVSTQVLTRSIDDKDKMHAIGSTLFMDIKVPSTWEVLERNGNKFLAKVEKDDIETIIRARRSRMQLHSSSSASFAQLVTSGAISLPQTGDTVKFFSSNDMMEGKVVSANDNTVTIKVGSSVYKVAPSAVYDIQLSSKHQAEENKKIYEYYKEAWGEDYAKLLKPSLGV